MSDTDSLLEEILSTILECATDALTAAGYTLPERTGVQHEAPDIPLDGSGSGDALGVYAGTIKARAYGESRPSAPGEGQMSGWHTTLPVNVELWASYPNTRDTGAAPEIGDLQTATFQIQRGAWAIWCELAKRRDSDTLFLIGDLDATLLTKRDIGMGSLTPLKPQGYAAGWKITLEVGLPALLENPAPGS